MLPLDLESKIISLPETKNHSIVIMTMGSLYCERFALRLQQEFGELVIAWYEVEKTGRGKKKSEPSSVRLKESEADTVSRIISKSKQITGSILRGDFQYTRQGIRKYCRSFVHSLSSRFFAGLPNPYQINMLKAEKQLFKEEVEKLRKYARTGPKRISVDEVFSDSLVREIKTLKPYFFLTLGGPIYPRSLLESIRGVAINQHAGHSPDYKGCHTVEWALYHRNLNCVSSTVHITSPGVDAGPILRRSNPCIFPHDNVFTIINRVIALGTELMIEAVADIMKNKKVRIFEQPPTQGTTFLSTDFNDFVSDSIQRDFQNGWLEHELTRVKKK